MNDTIVILEKSHEELVDAVTKFYSKEFDKTWGNVLYGIRKSQQWQPFSDDIKTILHAYKLQYRRMRRQEQGLFEDMDRIRGLELVQNLQLLHEGFEGGLVIELTENVPLSAERLKILESSMDYRLKKLHGVRRAIRLYIDQSKIILANARRTGCSDTSVLEAGDNFAHQYYKESLARLRSKPKPVQN